MWACGTKIRCDVVPEANIIYINMEHKHPNVFKNCLRCQVQLGNLEDAKKDMFFLVLRATRSGKQS